MSLADSRTSASDNVIGNVTKIFGSGVILGLLTSLHTLGIAGFVAGVIGII